MNKKGFSLLEIMVVVVVIGILAAIAIPSYNGYMSRTRRSEAITKLETIALYEERAFAETNQYVNLATLTGASYRCPDPNADANRNYDVAIILGGVNNSTYMATATPRNQLANDRDGNNDLIIFAIDNMGNRGRLVGAAVGNNPSFWNSLRP